MHHRLYKRKGLVVNLKPLPYLILVCALTLVGCTGKGGPAAAGGPGAGGAPPPPEVQVALVKPDSVDVYREYPAEFKPVQTVEIRTRVGGTLESVHFTEGSLVSAGQELFQIDPQPYYADIKAAQASVAKAQAGLSQSEARVSQARGALAQAQARLEKARTQVNFQQSSAQLAQAEATLDAAEREVRRYQPLKDQGAVPGQQYDKAVDQRDIARAARDALKAQLTNTGVSDRADVGVAEADVQSAKANVESSVSAVGAARADLQAAQNSLDTANLYLSYTSVKAPFTGFIGRLNLDRGTMIVQGNAVLATLNSADPMYADFSIAETEYLELRKAGGFSEAPFELTLSNAETYPHAGSFVLTENHVDPKTGAIVLRARFQNPNYLLKPGGFARIRMKNHSDRNAILVAQKAIFANQSLNSVYVVKADNTVEPRTVELGDRVGERVVVKSGLKKGELIIVDGLQKVRPGITVSIKTEAPAAGPGAAPKTGLDAKGKAS